LAIWSGAGRYASALGGQTLHSPDKTVPYGPANKNHGYEDRCGWMALPPIQDEEQTDDDANRRPCSVSHAQAAL